MRNHLIWGVLFAATFVAGCGGESSPPTNTLMEAVSETVAMNDSALGTAGPQLKTIIQSDTRGEWAFVIVADGAEPKDHVGRGTYLVANEVDGRMWKLLHGRIYRVSGKSLTWDTEQSGGKRAWEKSDADPLPDAVKKEWDQKWLDYVSANGYTVTEKK
jgi:hypothetical protein